MLKNNLLVLCVFSLALMGCGDTGGQNPESVNACIERGVNYYQSTAMPSGDGISDVYESVRNRCNSDASAY